MSAHNTRFYGELIENYLFYYQQIPTSSVSMLESASSVARRNNKEIINDATVS